MYCAPLMTAFADCGYCGHTCAAGQYCTDSTCILAGAGPACTGTQTSCPVPGGPNLYCVELSKDPANCGACGRTCPGGTSCNNGLCTTPTCAAPATACPGAGGGTFCADLGRDAVNCGACGKACANNAICSGGTCQGGGGTYAGLGACMGAGGAPFCTNLLNDLGNCGACGNVCAGGQSCFSGSCGTSAPPPVCPAGYEICTDQAASGKQFCSSPLFDSMNCGKCGNACGANMGCMNGTCVATGAVDAGTTQTCAYPNEMCPTAEGVFCLNVLSDPQNCGGCGNVCSVDTYCGNGTCTPTAVQADAGTAIKCVYPQQSCDPPAASPYCADFSLDLNNCGACFKACMPGYSCQAGACVPPASDGGAPDGGFSCGSGTSMCDGMYCADFTGDDANCGGCHITCTTQEKCMQGECFFIAP